MDAGEAFGLQERVVRREPGPQRSRVLRDRNRRPARWQHRVALRRRNRERESADEPLRLGRISPCEDDQLASEAGVAYLLPRLRMPIERSRKADAGQPPRALGI